MADSPYPIGEGRNRTKRLIFLQVRENYFNSLQTGTSAFSPFGLKPKNQFFLGFEPLSLQTRTRPSSLLVLRPSI